MFDIEINGRGMYDHDWDLEIESEDGSGGYTGPPEPKKITCKYCGKQNLIWRNFNGKWRLAECSISDPHNCL